MSAHIEKLSERKELQHFSHDHPLIYAEGENPKALCSACGVMLLSIPSYRCSKDCNFFLHHPCSELPQHFSNYLFNDLHYDIDLLAKPPPNSCKCQRCGKSCKNFTYICYGVFWWRNWGERIYLHCQCTIPPEINMKHISHREHSLVLLWKDASLECNACGSDRKGTFFFCPKCSFYIHQDCCLLPSIAKIKRHRHLLSLRYSFLRYWRLDVKNCLICHAKVSSRSGAYTCDICDRRAHLKCVASKLEELEIGQASMHLPNNKVETESEDVKSKIEKYHTDHSSWVFHNRESDIQLVCNACIQPITSPPISHYGCLQPQCDFLLHQSCANLPSVVKEYIGGRQINLYSESDNFCSMFHCQSCRKICNGFRYRSREFSIDVECAKASVIINHESHNQHPLTLTKQCRVTHCCNDDLYEFAYGYTCGLCKYSIHVHCASLPKTVEHKFDEHPLDLIHHVTAQIPHTEKEKEHDYLCEICEEDINPWFSWFYHCGECDQSFHVNCIPSTGRLSKIKFGRNIDLPRDIHDHPVTLTRMLTMGSQRCGHCEIEIQGFEDDMAFHCSMCDFWIHFECAKKVSGSDNTSSESDSSDDNQEKGDSSDDNQDEGDSSEDNQDEGDSSDNV